MIRVTLTFTADEQQAAAYIVGMFDGAEHDDPPPADAVQEAMDVVSDWMRTECRLELDHLAESMGATVTVDASIVATEPAS